MRAGAAACEEARASHQGLADGYAELIAEERSRREPSCAQAADAPAPVSPHPAGVPPAPLPIA